MPDPETSALIERYASAQMIAYTAGHRARTFFDRRGELTIEYKGVQDMVSLADRSVEELVRAMVRDRHPEDAVMGEELGGGSSGAEWTWVVDPIDGTACFVNGMYAWCVSVAVLRNGRPVIGCVYDPNADELFHARRGGGALLGADPIRVHPGTRLKDGVLGVGTSFRVGIADFVPFLERVLGDGGMFIRNGSGALMLAYVAAGRLIGYFEPHMNAWDALAGLVLVEEAGGATNDFMVDDGLDLGNPMIAGNAGIAAILATHAGLSLSRSGKHFRTAS